MSSDNQLYSATNYGLFVRKNGSFHPVKPAEGQKGNALFSLVEHKKKIYCCNLAGQIFRIENDHLVLVVTVPEKHLGSDIEISFTNQDDLIVYSKSYLRYNSTGWQLIEVAQSHLGKAIGINAFDPDKILIPLHSNTEACSVSNGEAHAMKLTQLMESSKVGYSRFLAYLNSSLVSIHGPGLFIDHTSGSLLDTINLNVRVFSQLGENEVWGLNRLGGLRKIRLEKGAFKISNNFLSDHFISCITKAKNGTVYLGTFHSGVIVIPKMSSSIISANNSFFTGLCSTEKGLVAIDKVGSIYDVDSNGTTLFRKDCIFPRGQILNVPNLDFNIDSSRKSLVYDAIKNDISGRLGVVKAIAKVDENTAIVATSRGVFRRGNGLGHINWVSSRIEHDWTQLEGSPFRCKAIAYNLENGRVYYATEHKLICVNSKNESRALLFKNKPIDCNNLIYADGAIWCASQSYGVLKIVNGEIVDQLDTHNGLRSNYVHKTQFKKNKLFISHKTGFQILNLETNDWSSIGPAEGLINGSVHDFCVRDENIWIISNGKIIMIPLNQTEKEKNYKLVVSSFQLGGLQLAGNSKKNFAHHENRLLVQFEFRGIEFEREAIIQYRLKGINRHWENLDATTNEIEFKALAPGSYQFEIRVNYRGEISEYKVHTFNILVPYWQSWWFYALLVILTALLVFLGFRIRVKQIKRKQIQTLKSQKMQTDVLDSELKALRSQMNPHFIFNSLNSIQDLVLREDKEKSYDYIVLFAKLVRSTLNYSNTDFIPIEKELEFLDVYLSLEKLRYGDDFKFEILTNKLGGIEIPSMIVQPFIENALLHGLMHKKGIKTLSISFNKGDQLTCCVTDNGIGRAKSNKIEQRQKTNHASFALKAIEQRLDLINKQVGQEIGKYTITDLFEEDEPVGTKVEIIIPFKR